MIRGHIRQDQLITFKRVLIAALVAANGLLAVGLTQSASAGEEEFICTSPECRCQGIGEGGVCIHNGVTFEDCTNDSECMD
jgi:hypothetical protein